MTVQSEQVQDDMQQLSEQADEQADKCTCPWVDERYWFSYYGAIEPGSTREWNPWCPEHPADEQGRTA